MLFCLSSLQISNYFSKGIFEFWKLRCESSKGIQGAKTAKTGLWCSK